MLHNHLPFYQALNAGVKPADTEERVHFLSVLKGESDPVTEHEKVYLKYLSSNMIKVDKMIYDWSIGKENPMNPNFDDEIFWLIGVPCKTQRHRIVNYL